MKEGNILDFMKVKRPEPVKIPYNISNSINWSKQENICSDHIVNKRKKSKPRKFASHKSSLHSSYPCHSDYLILKSRERIRHRQIDFIDGKFRGFKLMAMTGESIKDFQKQLYAKKQMAKEVAQNILPQSRRIKRDSNIKSADSEIWFKAGTEFLSGKKDSTTASRSPNSDCEKRSNGEYPKNMCDIRSYFMGIPIAYKMVQNNVFEIKREKKAAKQEED
jgi:hypothetical protein